MIELSNEFVMAMGLLFFCLFLLTVVGIGLGLQQTRHTVVLPAFGETPMWTSRKVTKYKEPTMNPTDANTESARSALDYSFEEPDSGRVMSIREYLTTALLDLATGNTPVSPSGMASVLAPVLVEGEFIEGRIGYDECDAIDELDYNHGDYLDFVTTLIRSM